MTLWVIGFLVVIGVSLVAGQVAVDRRRSRGAGHVQEGPGVGPAQQGALADRISQHQSEETRMGMRFRVISDAGVEISYADVPSLVAAYQRGEFVSASLMFDERTQRWQPASEHDAIVVATGRPASVSGKVLPGLEAVPSVARTTSGRAELGGIDVGAPVEPARAAHEPPPGPSTEEHLNALFVGRNWGGYYKRQFDHLTAHGGRFEVTWNWAAALAPGWYLYRKLWLPFLAWVGLSYVLIAVVGALTPGSDGQLVAALFMVAGLLIGQGMLGNFLLFRRAHRVIADVGSVYDSGQVRAAEVSRRGGVALWAPVVIVGGYGIVVIGILAAIAIPRFANTKEKAYIASMKADLRNLVTAQEAYFADNVTYSHAITNLNYAASSGNIIEIMEASGTGWSATSSNAATSKTCGIFVGSVTPPVFGQAEGAPTCQ